MKAPKTRRLKLARANGVAPRKTNRSCPKGAVDTSGAAELLGVCTATVRSLTKKGHLRAFFPTGLAFRHGVPAYYWISDIQVFLNKQATKCRQKPVNPNPNPLMPVAKETSTFEPAPAGTHVARCYGCISLGTQHSENYADAFKVRLLFELPHEKLTTKDGKEMPMTVSKDYTLSLSKKANLRKALDSWRGRSFTATELEGFEVANVVGAPCQLTLVHKTSAKGSTYANIEAITGLAKGTTCPPLVHGTIRYEIEDGRNPLFSTFPDWIKEMIEACEEWKPSTQKAPDLDHVHEPGFAQSEPDPEPPEDDSVPF